MPLKNQIEQDFIDAYKKKETEKVSVLRMVKTALKNYEIDQKIEVTDLDVIKVLKKELKQREDSVNEYKKANRNDLIEKETIEIDIIKAYLPTQLDHEETKKLVSEAIAETNAIELKDMGKVIKVVLEKAKGQADGKKVSEITKELLQQK